MFLSIIAFAFGLATIAGASYEDSSLCVAFHAEHSTPIDIIQSAQSYRYVTSVVWYASQTAADCLISCKPHFFSSGDVDAHD